MHASEKYLIPSFLVVLCCSFLQYKRTIGLYRIYGAKLPLCANVPLSTHLFIPTPKRFHAKLTGICSIHKVLENEKYLDLKAIF